MVKLGGEPTIKRVYSERGAQLLTLLSASSGLACLLLGDLITSTICLSTQTYQ